MTPCLTKKSKHRKSTRKDMLRRLNAVSNAEELNLLALEASDMKAMEALVKREYETAQAQAQLAVEIHALEENSAKAIQAANARKSVAQRRAQELREMLKAKKLAKASTTTDGYRHFLSRVGTVYSELAQRKTAFAQIASYAPQDLRHASIDVAHAYAGEWVRYCDAVERELAELEAQGQSLAAHGADASSVTDLRELLEDAKSLYVRIVSEVTREHTRREAQADSIADFLRSQGQLVHWCRAQKSALESVHDAEQVQELCTSFQNNVSVMETNLLVLLELSEPLAPNAAITQALIEVNEVWLSLAVFAYEKLRDTMLVQHVQSGLQPAARKWLGEFSEPLKKFLDDAQTLLKGPTDDDSRTVTQPVLEQCQALLEDFAPHNVIIEHLSDFQVREDCLKEHYNAIRRAIFARLTLMTLSFHGQVQYPRRQEYTDRLAELTDWVQCKSQSGAWKQLLSRVAKMKQLIEENEVLHGTAEERNTAH